MGSGGRGRVGQVNLCVETIYPSCGGGGGEVTEGEEAGAGALGPIGVGVCDTRDARSRRWCAGGGERGSVRGGGRWELPQRHGRLQNDCEVIYRAWKCFFTVADFDMRVGRVSKRERNNEGKKEGGGERGGVQEV